MVTRIFKALVHFVQLHHVQGRPCERLWTTIKRHIECRVARLCDNSQSGRSWYGHALNAPLGPSILFADEPTGNLDSQTGHDVMQLFHSLHKEGQTIILITHENEVAAEAQRTIFIKDGLIESDTRKELL